MGAHTCVGTHTSTMGTTCSSGGKKLHGPGDFRTHFWQRHLDASVEIVEHFCCGVLRGEGSQGMGHIHIHQGILSNNDADTMQWGEGGNGAECCVEGMVVTGGWPPPAAAPLLEMLCTLGLSVWELSLWQ